jgi:type IV secretory pathway VirB4 component
MAGTFANAQDLVMVKDIKQSTIILKDGGMRQVVMVGGTNFSLKSATEQNVLTSAYQNFLNSLAFPIQILIHSRKINIANYLEVLEKRKGEEVTPLLKNQIEEYSAFVGSFVQQNAIMQKSFFVIVPFVPASLPTKSSIMGFLPFGKKNKSDEQKQDEDHAFNEAVGQLKQRTTQVIEGLGVVGLEAVLLNDESLTELFYNFYNPETIEKREVNIHQ